MPRSHFLPRFLLILPVVAILAGLAFWYAPGARTVGVVSPRQGTAVDLVYATGVVEPVAQAVLSAQSAGELAALLADEGDSVKAGQEMARLDSTAATQQVNELTAQLEWEGKSLERAKALRARGAGSQEALDDAISRVAQATARLEAAKDELARRSLTSPIDGTVLRRDGEVGEYLPAGRQVFVVGAPGTLRVALEVDEEDFPRVALGQKVLMTADAFTGQVFEGSVSEITPQGDALSKSYRVRVRLPEGRPLPVGMTVEANVVLGEKANALLVPSSALAGHMLFVVEGRHAVSREVVTGITGFKETEVVSGLSAGERVIAQPPGDLKNGERVRVTVN